MVLGVVLSAITASTPFPQGRFPRCSALYRFFTPLRMGGIIGIGKWGVALSISRRSVSTEFASHSSSMVGSTERPISLKWRRNRVRFFY